MKVRVLVEKLKSMDQEAEVYLSKDEDGNGHERVGNVCDDGILLEDPLCGVEMLFFESWGAEACEMTEEQFAEFIKQKHCVVMLPQEV